MHVKIIGKRMMSKAIGVQTHTIESNANQLLSHSMYTQVTH